MPLKLHHTMEQLEQFFDLAHQEGEVYYTLMQLCYYGGLRLSEALGLRWSNVHWETGKITVDHQLIYNKNTHIAELTTTKSKTSRIFDAPPALVRNPAELEGKARTDAGAVRT